jgi:hypothetical protein
VESSVTWCLNMKISQWPVSGQSARVRLSVHFHITSIILRQIEFCRFVAPDVCHLDVENVQQPEQSAFDGLNGFFRDIGPSISESNSEFILLSRNTQIFWFACDVMVNACLL